MSIKELWTLDRALPKQNSVGAPVLNSRWSRHNNVSQTAVFELILLSTSTQSSARQTHEWQRKRQPTKKIQTIGTQVEVTTRTR